MGSQCFENARVRSLASANPKILRRGQPEGTWAPHNLEALLLKQSAASVRPACSGERRHSRVRRPAAQASTARPNPSALNSIHSCLTLVQPCRLSELLQHV